MRTQSQDKHDAFPKLSWPKKVPYFRYTVPYLQYIVPYLRYTVPYFHYTVPYL